MSEQNVEKASILDQWHDMQHRAAMTLDGERSAQNFLLGSLATILDDYPEEAERVACAMQRAIEYALSLTPGPWPAWGDESRFPSGGSQS